MTSNGSAFVPSSSVELYDAGRGEWRAGPNMRSARAFHTATPLNDGRVLVVGGKTVAADSQPEDATDSVEIYDPISGSWSDAAAMPTRREGHTATRLSTGHVLVVGGSNNEVRAPGIHHSDAIRYDPGNPSAGWVAAGTLGHGREGHTATLLGDGRVLVVGGYRGHSFDPDLDSPRPDQDPVAAPEVYSAPDVWQPAPDDPVGATHRQFHTATLLPDGRVLIAGGQIGTGSAAPERSSLLYRPGASDPAEAWTPARAFLDQPRRNHSSTLLANGKVLVVGGIGSFGRRLPSARLYNAATDAWEDAGKFEAKSGRGGHTATLLDGPGCAASCGKVVVAGGGTDRPAGEVYSPAPEVAAIEANRGSPGTPVVLTGIGLASAKSVKVKAVSKTATVVCGASRACSIDPVSPDGRLRLTMPAHGAGQVRPGAEKIVKVIVTTDGGASVPVTFTYVGAPAASVTPPGAVTPTPSPPTESPGEGPVAPTQNTPPAGAPPSGASGGAPAPAATPPSPAPVPAGEAGSAPAAVQTASPAPAPTAAGVVAAPAPPVATGQVVPVAAPGGGGVPVAAPNPGISPAPNAGGSPAASPGAVGAPDASPQPAPRHAMVRPESGSNAMVAAGFVGGAVLMFFACILFIAIDPGAARRPRVAFAADSRAAEGTH